MLPDRVSNPGPLTYESGVLPIALRGPNKVCIQSNFNSPNTFGTMKYVRDRGRSSKRVIIMLLSQETS